jgi:hypothetical protein
MILYSFIGDFEKAKEVADINWVLLYIPTYIFAIWDSYRTTVDMNHNYILASREDAEIKPFRMSALEINYLDKRRPWISAAWSLLIPGTGQLYIHRIVTAAFVVIWWIVVAYLSRTLPAIHYTLLGDFSQAKTVLDMHWFLNVPSIYFFAMYDAYTNTVENNKLYDWEQSKFFKRDYQSKSFKMPDKKVIGDNNMYIVSTFEHSKYLELAITAIEMKGIEKDNILAVPMDKRAEDRTVFDSIHGADGLSMIDIPAILATIFGIFGSVYGFVLKWGPLLWGLIGIFVGTVVGFIVKFAVTKKFNNRQGSKKGTEVVLIIQCKENQLEMVKDTLWAHYALGVRKLDI